MSPMWFTLLQTVINFFKKNLLKINLHLINLVVILLGNVLSVWMAIIFKILDVTPVTLQIVEIVLRINLHVCNVCRVINTTQLPINAFLSEHVDLVYIWVLQTVLCVIKHVIFFFISTLFFHFPFAILDTNYYY